MTSTTVAAIRSAAASVASTAALARVVSTSRNLVDAMFGQQTSRGPRSRVRRGQDALVRLDLELAEAAFGTTKPLRVDTAVLCPRCNGSGASEGSRPVRCPTCHGQGDVTHVQRSFIGDIRTTQPCPTCHGYGTVIPDPCVECSGDGRVRATRTINVKIPAGVSTGNRIHLSSQGEVGAGGGPAGDLYVELQVIPHEVFRREGDDLEVVVKIPMTAAALGTEVMVATLEADLEDSAAREPELSGLPCPPGHSPAPASRSMARAFRGCAAAGVGSSGSPCSSRLRRGSTTSSGICSASWPSSGTRPGPRSPCRSTAAAFSGGCGTRSPASEAA